MDEFVLLRKFENQKLNNLSLKNGDVYWCEKIVKRFLSICKTSVSIWGQHRNNQSELVHRHENEIVERDGLIKR